MPLAKPFVAALEAQDAAISIETAQTTGGISLLLPEATPSVNRMHGFHWSKKYKERRKWAWLVKAARLEAGLFHVKPPAKASVQIDRYGARVLDHDNFVAGTKFLTDALVAEGFLVDDSPANITAIYRQHVGKPHRTIVIIEAL